MRTWVRSSVWTQIVDPSSVGYNRHRLTKRKRLNQPDNQGGSRPNYPFTLHWREKFNYKGIFIRIIDKSTSTIEAIDRLPYRSTETYRPSRSK